MNTVHRLDVGELRSPEILENGYLKAECFATRAGIFVYRQPDGTVRREYRPEAEVFKSQSLNSLAGVPVTNEHPPILLDSKNTEQYQKGFTGEQVQVVDAKVAVNITVTDEDLIKRIQKGKVETSCGYKCETIEEPGYFEGQPYDAIQTNIVYNHIAVVNRGRAGREVRINLDAASQIIDEVTMTKIRIDGVDLEVSEAVALAFQNHEKEVTKRMDMDKEEMDGLKGKLDAAKAEFDSLKKDMEKMEKMYEDMKKDMSKSKKMDSAELDAIIAKRLELVETAKAFLPEEKFDGLSDMEIKKKVIESRVKEVKFDDASDSYIDGLFMGVAANKPEPKKPENKMNKIGEELNKNRNDSAVVISADDARKKAIEESLNAWRA